MKVNKKKIVRGRPFENDNDLDSSTKDDGGGRPKSKFSMRKRPAPAVSTVKSRKELRKQLRKAKKAQKHQYILVKCGRADLVQKAADELAGKKKKKRKKKKKKKGNKSEAQKEDEEGAVGTGEKVNEEEIVKVVKVEVKGSGKKGKGERERLDPALELRKEEEQLKLEMEEVRRKRMIEENEEEERNIRQLSKKLKLNKRANIPASFRTDGLDYLLEVCERTSGSKSKKNEGSDDDEDDEENDLEGDSGDAVGEEDLDEEMDVDDDEEEESEEGDLDAEIFGSGEEDESLDLGEDDGENASEEDSNGEAQVKAKGKAKKTKKNEEKEDDGVWEDIYGRLRSKDGAVLVDNGTRTEISTEKTASGGKYVPPMLRGNQAKRDKIIKQLKGLLNRLSESNMHSIAKQVEEMYMANSRNEMNQTLLELLTQALVRPTMMPERVVLEHIMLIAILHANVGTEVGAFFIQSFTQEFKSTYDVTELSSEDENKELENLSLIISYIYHFKIVDACLIYDILKLLGESFKAKDIEIILTILRSIGFRLRKDNPTALKDLIIMLQQKASKLQAGETGSAKVKFMLEILLAIRNNNMNKIPNYDPSFGDHLQKILKSHLHPGTYVSEMKIGLKDLLNVDKAGRWWIVGSAWTGKQADEQAEEEDSVTATMSSEDAAKHAKLLKHARAQGMNTDARRNIFCILMTAEDYLDAFEKLNHLDLRNNQDREIIHVSTYCCLQEKRFNPFYALIASKFATTDRKLMYPPSFKEEICKYAEALGQRSASRLFGISQKRIFDWISDAKCQPESSVRKRAAVLRTRRRNLSKIRKSLVYYTGSIEMKNFPQPKPTTKEIDAKVETEIHEWIRSQEPRQVPSTEVRQKAKDIYRKYGRVEIECSYGWYRRFKARLNSNGKLLEGRHEEDDQIVLTWLLQVYDNNDLVSYKDLQSYAQKALQKIKPEFKASAGWAMRFLKRNHAVINWDGIYSNPLPPSLENQVTTCRGQLKSFFEQYSMNAIGCMDEIPLSFTNSTLVKKGSVNQPVSRLRKNSIKNCDATVILSLLADSTLLPPMLIVKGRLNSSMDQVYNTPYSPIVTYYSNSTEPSSTSLEKWLDLIWSKNENMEKLWLRYLKPAGEDCGEKIRLPTTNEVVAWVQQSFEVTKFQKDKLEQSFQRVIEG